MSNPEDMDRPQVTPPPQYPTLPPLPASAPMVVAQPPKNPWIALILSFLFPGVGQIYNGQVAKALFFFGAFVGNIYICATNNPLPFALFFPFIIFWNLIDAYRSSTLINDAWAGGRRAEVEDMNEGPGWGIALAGIGVVLLLNNLGWLHLEAVARYWPVLLIVAGLAFLRRSLQGRNGKGNAPTL